MDALGIFLTIAGFVIGLGAVTVIDLHGFLGRNSPYWTEATIRTHKVTKPLIWIGMALAIIGSTIVYWETGFTGYVPLQTFIAAVLVFNGCFLSFWVSPRLLERERQGKESVRFWVPKNMKLWQDEAIFPTLNMSTPKKTLQEAILLVRNAAVCLQKKRITEWSETASMQ